MTAVPSNGVHFIGIGGAGMSAIAKVLIERGVTVSGSDLKWSGAAAMLEAIGAHVHIGHDAELIEPGRLVVVSSAIPDSNPEFRRARELGLRIMSRGEALAEVLEGSRAIVVAGTHGKTTTTSMIVTILRAAGLDPTYLIGAGLNDAGTNARTGRGEFAVAESDESDGSFLLLTPDIAVVTNLEIDHVDYWDSIDSLRAAFARFMARVPDGGTVVVPSTDVRLVELAGQAHRRVITFDGDGDVIASGIDLAVNGVQFLLECGVESVPVGLRVPGRHNVANALAAAAACVHAGVPLDEVGAGLGTYRGVERRFDLRGEVAGVTVIDDYAHHPTEVRATLAAARPGPWRRVLAVFQPHRYSRTAALAGEFGGSFADADRIIVTEVYGAGEDAVPGVTGKLVADAIGATLPGRPIAYLPHRSELLDYLAYAARPGDAVITLGAGDVSTVGDELLARLGARPALPPAAAAGRARGEPR
ncbi:MAG: UDP-N-acetylmuramate--L-alanine ligase [Actinomycetota bacterium]